MGTFTKVAGPVSARARMAKIGGALAALALAGAGMAAAASDAPGRYSMTPADGGGVIRLDTETGAMSLCKRELQDQWSCADMKEEQHASANAELERLKEENKALKEQVDRLEETLGINEDAAGEPKPGMKLSLPSEADVDKAFDYLERMFDKLHERVERLQKRHPPTGDGTAL